MDRLSALDTAFLDVEDRGAPMHIAVCCTFPDPAPSLDELTALMASRLHAVPRYRQVAVDVPLDLGRPVWVDDDHFDLSYHVRHTALPSPGGDDELRALVGRLGSIALDRDRPLWETWLVEGLAGDRWALLCKVHHCLVDGVAGMGLLTAVLSAEPSTDIDPPEPWEPAPAPSAPAMVLDGWRGLAGDVERYLTGVPAALGRPVEAVRSLGRVGQGLVRLGGNLVRPPRRLPHGGIGSHRVWAHARATLDDVGVVRRGHGGTVNDVVVAAVAGGYRRLLLGRGEDPATAVVRVAIPVSVRTGDADATGNRVSVMITELPVQLDDPVERLDAVRARLGELKASHEAEAGAAAAGIADLWPPMLLRTGTQLVIRAEHVVAQGFVDTVVTNVPGPQFPIYCLGRRMQGAFPYLSLTYGIQSVCAITSYDGVLCFGATGDRDAAPDVEAIVDGAVDEIARLVGAAGGAATPTEPPR